jgi:hypothetical protein
MIFYASEKWFLFTKTHLATLSDCNTAPPLNLGHPAQPTPPYPQRCMHQPGLYLHLLGYGKTVIGSRKEDGLSDALLGWWNALSDSEGVQAFSMKNCRLNA